MKKIALFICALHASCSISETANTAINNDVKITRRGPITVVGIAKEGTKTGALVESEPGDRYFINDLREWPDSILGKKVRVSGNLVIVDRRELFKRVIYIQGVAYQTTLEHAKWEVIK